METDRNYSGVSEVGSNWSTANGSLSSVIDEGGAGRRSRKQVTAAERHGRHRGGSKDAAAKEDCSISYVNLDGVTCPSVNQDSIVRRGAPLPDQLPWLPDLFPGSLPPRLTSSHRGPRDRCECRIAPRRPPRCTLERTPRCTRLRVARRAGSRRVHRPNPRHDSPFAETHPPTSPSGRAGRRRSGPVPPRRG
jgi:hypothetical protein